MNFDPDEKLHFYFLLICFLQPPIFLVKESESFVVTFKRIKDRKKVFFSKNLSANAFRHDFHLTTSLFLLILRFFSELFLKNSSSSKKKGCITVIHVEKILNCENNSMLEFIQIPSN